MNYCSNCGEKITEETNFCANCGTKIKADLNEGSETTGNLWVEKFKKIGSSFLIKFKENKKFRLGIFGISVLIVLFLFLGIPSDERNAIRAVKNEMKMSFGEDVKVTFRDFSAELTKREDPEIGEEGNYEIHGFVRMTGDEDYKEVYEFIWDVDFLEGVFIPEHTPQMEEIHEGDVGYF